MALNASRLQDVLRSVPAKPKCAEGRARTGAQRGARAAGNRPLSARFLLEQMTSFLGLQLSLLFILIEPGRNELKETTSETIPQQQ